MPISGFLIHLLDSIFVFCDPIFSVIQSSEQALALTIISEACLIGGDLDPRSTFFRVPSMLITNQGSLDTLSSVDSRQLITVGIKYVAIVFNWFDVIHYHMVYGLVLTLNIFLSSCTTLIISNSPSKYLAGFLHSLLAKLYYRLALRHSSDTLGRGLYHAKKAVSLDSSNHTYWNLVGIIAEGKNSGNKWVKGYSVHRFSLLSF